MPSIISGRDVIGAMEDLGWVDDEIGLPRSGIRQARRARRQDKRRGRTGSAAVAQQAAMSQNFGQPMTLGTDLIGSSQRRQPFGLGNVTLTSTSLTASLTAIAQKPMQPLAMTISAIYTPSGGSSVEGNFLLTVDDIKLGTSSQLAGVGQVPASYFRPDTVQSLLTFSPIGPGVTVQINLSSAALAAGDTLVVGASLLCVVAEQ